MRASPSEFLARSELCKTFWDEIGTRREDEIFEISGTSLEEKLAKVDGSDRKQALDFVQGMLMWKPEERRTARECLMHPFMQYRNDDLDELEV